MDFFNFDFLDKTTQIIMPERNDNVEITSACVGWNPNKLMRVLTLIFSMKNRSSPFKMRYKANNVPGILNFFRY